MRRFREGLRRFGEASSRLLILTVTAAVVCSSSAEAARPLYIKADSKGVDTLGGFHPKRNPTLRAAIRALGQPSGKRGRGSEACTVRWSDIGLVVLFANFGANDACSPGFGRVQSVVIKGSKARPWRTDRGLRLGDSLARLRLLYPATAYHSGGYYPQSWWLVVGSSPYGQGCPCPVPVLRAKLTRGRASSFRLWVGAAGD
jgi:hypothetical protein